jgi:hypothetical protein
MVPVLDGTARTLGPDSDPRTAQSFAESKKSLYFIGAAPRKVSYLRGCSAQDTG